jgi:RHS repeat-associated protein
MRTDLLVGVQFADNRVYSPTLMRWLQTDPIGLNAGNNDYEFVGNGPISSLDPSGLFVWEWMNLEPAYDENGKRILPMYTEAKGYGFNAYGVYSYYDMVSGEQIVPCVICHGKNGEGRLPGLTSTDSFVGGRWYLSGSSENIIRNHAAGLEKGFNDFMSSLSPKFDRTLEKIGEDLGGKKECNPSPILNLDPRLIDRNSLIYQSGEIGGRYGPEIILLSVGITKGMGGRVLSAAEQAEFDAFALRAQK